MRELCMDRYICASVCVSVCVFTVLIQSINAIVFLHYFCYPTKKTTFVPCIAFTPVLVCWMVRRRRIISLVLLRCCLLRITIHLKIVFSYADFYFIYSFFLHTCIDWHHAGDATSSYLWTFDSWQAVAGNEAVKEPTVTAADIIAKTTPLAKFVFVLRNPTERCIFCLLLCILFCLAFWYYDGCVLLNE